MSAAAKHTPTPWRLMVNQRNATIAIVAENDAILARVVRGGTPNAAFIVRAVNAHDALREVCRHIETYAASRSQSPTLWTVQQEARAALALAEGGAS